MAAERATGREIRVHAPTHVPVRGELVEGREHGARVVRGDHAEARVGPAVQEDPRLHGGDLPVLEQDGSFQNLFTGSCEDVGVLDDGGPGGKGFVSGWEWIWKERFSLGSLGLRQGLRGWSVGSLDLTSRASGQEESHEQRERAFAAYQVTPDLMELAEHDAIFMHDLPAHRGEETVDEVIEGPQSVVFDQAENRLHAQRAVLFLLLGDERE